MAEGVNAKGVRLLDTAQREATNGTNLHALDFPEPDLPLVRQSVKGRGNCENPYDQKKDIFGSGIRRKTGKADSEKHQRVERQQNGLD